MRADDVGDGDEDDRAGLHGGDVEKGDVGACEEGDGVGMRGETGDVFGAVAGGGEGLVGGGGGGGGEENGGPESAVRTAGEKEIDVERGGVGG